jgi:Predicted Zn-dependent peptidases
MREIDVKKQILKNGLRLVTTHRDSDLFSIGVGIRAGSLYEDENNSGISHLIEHMLFKGTNKRNIDRLSDDIEGLAGDLDIYTTYHETVLTASIMKYRSRECLEIIADMFMNSTFPEKELRLEKKVIIEEIKMTRDDLEDWSYMGLYKSAFPDSWHRYNIAGTIKTVRSIKRNTIIDFYRSFYVPRNTVICIASSYTHDEVFKMVDEFFGSWDGGDRKEVSVGEYNILSQKIIRHKKGIEQAHILYGFDIHSLTRKEQVALAMLNKKLGSGTNSILFRELRDRKGYAYSVYSDMDLIKGIGMFYIYAAISKENLKGATSLIDDIIRKFRDGLLTVDEKSIELINNMYYTDTAEAIESPSHIVDYLLDGEIGHDNPLEYQNVLSMIKTINTGEIKEVGSKVLRNPVVHILLPA